MKPEDVKPSLQSQLAVALTEGKLRKARRIAESLLLWDDFGGSDLFDRVRPSSNDSSDATRWVPLSVPSDRRHGSRWPVFRTHIELDEFRQQSRLRLAINGYAKGLLRNLANNVIGKGFSYTVTPIVKKGDKAKKGEETPEALDEQTGLVDKVQKVLDDFLRLNNWNGGTHPSTDGVVVTTREREIFRRVKGEDGECFLRFHLDNNGTVLIRIIEPEQVRDMGGLPEDGWSFGIQHQMSPYEDIERPLMYRVFWPDPSATGGEGDNGDNGGTYEDIDADQVLHIKGPDTPSTVKRGLSEFLFDVGRALDRASKLQRNASLGAAFRAATGEIWQHSVGTQQQIQDLAAGLGEQQTASDGTTETVERVRPPMIRRIPKSQELVPLPADQSESYLAAGQGDLRMAASAFCAPEFWMAETSSGNYSNLESAAAPAVRDGQAEQEYYKAAYARVAWKALLWAAECGRLPRGFEEKVKIEVEAPAVLHQNELEDAQVKSIEAQNGVLSPQTWCAEKGRDYDIESANMQAHQAQFGMPGMGLDPNDPEGGGGQGGPPGGPGKPPGANGQPPKPKSTSDYVKESAESGGRWITLGAKKKGEGGRSGGSPVFVVNGRITKGAPSLTGKKIDALKEKPEARPELTGSKKQQAGQKAAQSRQENEGAKGYSRAQWGKKAKAEGHKPAELHQLAAEMLAHDKAHKDDVKSLLQSVRADHPHVKALTAQGARGRVDASMVKGLDDIASEAANSKQWGHVFPHDADPEHHLFDLLTAGNPEYMSEDEAYETALKELNHHKRSSGGVVGSWDDIPESKESSEGGDQ